jgi:hypothetical protein
MLASAYYNYMRQLESMLNIPEPQIQSQLQTSQSLPTSTDAAIETIFKIRYNIIDAILKRNRF